MYCASQIVSTQKDLNTRLSFIHIRVTGSSRSKVVIGYKADTYVQSVSAHEWAMGYFINAKAVDTANPQMP